MKTIVRKIVCLLVVLFTSIMVNGQSETIKTLINQLNGTGTLEDNGEGANRIFDMLKNDAETLPQPMKSIAYSMLGQLYWEYGEVNKEAISHRTTMDIEQQDVRTWDSRKLMDEAIKYYRLSLSDVETLQNEPAENYRIILLPNEEFSYQPTLYDLLTNRMLAFYLSYIPPVSSPQTVFMIDNPDYYADAQTFSNLNIQTEDTLSVAFLWLKTYQDLLRFHLKRSGFGALTDPANNSIAALIDIDLRRVSSIRRKGTYADNEKLYEEALVRMSKVYHAYNQNVDVLLRLGEYYFNIGAQWRQYKQEDYKAGYSKAYEICEQLEKDYPNQQSASVEALKERILDKELSMQTEGGQIPNQPFLARLQVRNIETLYETVYRLTEEQALAYIGNRSAYGNNRDSFYSTFFRSLNDEVLQKQVTLPSVTDYQYYTTEVRIPPLEDGLYILVLSDTKEWLDSATVYANVLVQVSPLMTLNRSIDDMLSIIVTDLVTGEPVADAKITMCQYGTVQDEFTSDKNGIATTKSYKNMTHYRVSVGDRQFIKFGVPVSQTVERKDGKFAIVFTDRSVYRPGQTVYYKAIMYKWLADKDKELAVSQTVKVQLRDMFRRIVAEKSLTTDEFGSVDGSFILPKDVLHGTMTVEFEDLSATMIRVETYKRPAFGVKFEPVEENLTLNRPVTVTALAKALAGYPLDQAQVQYRVVRNTRHRIERKVDYIYFPLMDTQREISAGKLKTDENGHVPVTFTAIADDANNDNRFYIYTVTVDVTDVNGETHSASLDVCIGNKPLLVNTNLTKQVLYNQKDRFTIETSNLNGTFTPASVKVEIESLKSPGKLFHPNPERFEVLEKVAEYTVETADNKNLDLSSLKHSGYYKLNLTADNKKGVVVAYTRYFYYTSDQPDEIGSMDYWLTVVKDTVKPGEQAAFLIAGGEDDTYVYYEVMHQLKTIEAKWIKTGKRPVKVTFPIKEEHHGVLTVQCNMVQNGYLYSETRHITVPAKRLDIKLTTFRDRLLPGERETWTIQINNKETAEIVASLYDASLDTLKPHHWNHISWIYGTQTFPYSYSWKYAVTSSFNHSWSASRMNNPYGGKPSGKLYANLNWFDGTYKKALGGANTWMRGAEANNSAGITAENLAFHKEDIVYFGKARKEPFSIPIINRYDEKAGMSDKPDIDLTVADTSTNYNETVFFYPKLRTNKNGEALIKFTVPKAHTRWKLLIFAHTKDLKVGTYTNELVTQKQVAISANEPRFFRENDVIELTAKVSNLTETDLNGQALLQLYDAATMQPVDNIIQSETTQPFNVATDGSVALRWKLAIPAGIQAITCRLTAQAGTHTDGEEITIPVLTNAMSVTETLPFNDKIKSELGYFE